MEVGLRRALVTAALVMFSPFALPSVAQQPDAAVKAVLITGLAGVKNNTKGTLVVEGGNLHFRHAQIKADVAATSVEDVITGNDSERLLHGTLGDLTMFAPYGSGRFLSLFRTKLETVTIKYRNADGGLCGAIFTMPVGKAEVVKKEMLAQGARTTVPVEAASDAPAKTPATKEQKQ